MKRQIFLIILLSIIFFPLNDVLGQQVISSSGNHFKNTNGSLSWTIGELAIKTIESDELILTQGFHQTRLTLTGINLIPGYLPDIEAYPNPTADKVNIKIGELIQGGEWQYVLYDKNGRKLMQNKINSDLSDLSVASLPKAIYFLKVFGGDKESKIFKIVKN